jgi:SEC-C motif-containing protein
MPKCPCDSNVSFEQCCAPIINGASPAATAESLMRSRYTAFTLRDENHLLATWHPEQRPSKISFDPTQKWLGLKIKRTEAGQPNDKSGIVEFLARYKIAGQGYRLHEVSRFEKLSGKWLYVDGDLKS